jgi:hypothetical protein
MFSKHKPYSVIVLSTGWVAMEIFVFAFSRKFIFVIFTKIDLNII